MRKKILFTIGLVLLVGIAGFALYLSATGPELPANTDEIITEVLNNDLPELITGETGFADSGGIQIWYESMLPEGTPRGAVILIPGISSDGLAWPPKLVDALLDAGYQVIRYDPRGTGMSDWMEDWDSTKPYSLADMAADCIAVLDALDIEAAHVVGVSMGGMVAQQMTIDYPARVLTLTSIMSSGDIVDPRLPPLSMVVVRELLFLNLKYGLIRTERNMMKLHVASRVILRGESTYALDVKTIAEQTLYNLRERKGFNLQSSPQHNGAVITSGSRYTALLNVRRPTLIIHGLADPFVPIEHSYTYAAFIPDADTLWIEGMGHDLPDIYIEPIIEKMLAHFEQIIEVAH
jgi:pimeloyl-ACP methyl ester carboxylesterase